MVFKKHWYDFIKLELSEKKPDWIVATMVNSDEANVLLWRDMEGVIGSYILRPALP
jgi:hypothetical protein